MFVLPVDDDIELRLHDTHNVDGLFALINRNRAFIGQWMEWSAMHKTVDNTYRYVMWEREQYADQKQISTQIYYQGEIAGSVGLVIHDWRGGFAEIGYWLGQSFTGKGIATRAARAMVNFAFNTLNLHKVVIRAIADNVDSIAVAKRLNFRFQGLEIKQRLLRGNYYDYNVHYILRDQWQDTATSDFRRRIDDHTELRPLMMHHAPNILRLISTHRNTLRQWVEWVDAHRTLNDTKSFIMDALERYGDYNGLDTGIWIDGEFAGQVNFNSWSLRNYKADLGYWLATPYRGKGIMTKAVRALVDYGFNTVGLHRIELLCALENEKSCAIANRLNFTREGTMRRGERIRNRYYDVDVYAILENDWQSKEQ